MVAVSLKNIGLMNLQQKEKYGKTSGPLWSSVLMGFLRNNDALDPAEDAPARLANCDDLRPLEQANCLWVNLLLHRCEPGGGVAAAQNMAAKTDADAGRTGGGIRWNAMYCFYI